MTSTRIQTAVLFFFLAASAILWVSAAGQDKAPAIGDPAPDFQLTAVDGKTHSLSEFKGKIVVLEWTNPGCPVVQRHYKNGLMPGAQKEICAKGIVWLAVNSTNPGHRDFKTGETLKQIYSEWNAAFTTLLLDPDGKAGKSFGAKTTPHTFVIDKDGKLVYNGAIDDDPQGNKETRTNYVRLAVDSLLKGDPIATTTTKSYGCSVKYAE
jgi:peroxiredoxin